MQTVGPYTLLSTLGSCQVGDAWSGLDESGGPVTVAVLNARASADQRWRDAFAATATALAQAHVDRLPIVAADFRADAPWVACLPERGPGAAQIFLALGQNLRAPDAEPEPERFGSLDAPTMALPALTFPAPRPPADETQPTPSYATPSYYEPPYTGSAADYETPAPASSSGPPNAGAGAYYETPPAATAPVSGAAPTSSSAAPTSAAPNPYYAAPISAAPSPYYATPTSAAPGSPAPTSGAAPDDRPYPPLVLRPPSALHKEHQRARRTLILVAVGALALGLIVGILGTLVLSGGEDDDGRSATGAPSPAAAALDPALPTTPPSRPGIEPPQGGGWPTPYPSFTDAEPTTTMNLDGFGFEFTVPAGWQCEPNGRTSGYAAYGCGVPNVIGGDVVVRTCAPCTESRRDELRQLEEAWGLPWIRTGPFATFAEGAGVENGRSGLVYLQYWRSDKDDAIDRQLVVRMTAPPGHEDILRKVVNSIRAVTFTI